MTEALKLPTKVIDSEWRDDIGFESYDNEAEYKYVPPATVEKITAKQAKSRDVRIGRVALFSRNDKLAA